MESRSPKRISADNCHTSTIEQAVNADSPTAFFDYLPDVFLHIGRQTFCTKL